ncbi:AAA family ATPase [Natronocalculus amylovorans]|uniref:AAA family ATPase n=1 Tax=Natronocalculus amylovorans TaxID=2917812 RepID=A0AAE3K9S6_9EURY|nr:AAA family ATPase [Natronocalculus amylovorans]MCL9818381.1 AAA family ATPase [Natronocalculus amylovorans]
MPDNNVASVKTVLESSGELIVIFDNQNTFVVIDQTSEDVTPGDIVKIDEQVQYASEIVSTGGYDTGSLVGVIKRISSDRVVVKTENTHMGVANPDGIDVEIEDTVELNGAVGRIIRVIEGIDPPSFDVQQEEFDVDDYRTEDPEDSFEDIGGLKRIKERVREVVELPLQKAEEFEDIGAEAPTGVLFHGPPGTGKTLFARAVANSLDEGTFYNIKGPEILNKWYGESEKQIRLVFEDAEKQEGPSIIFIDEIESLASSREDSRDVDRRIVAQLLTLMDGFEEYEDVIVIAATNRPEDIDQALLRPGRFDREVEFPSKLSIEDREDILKTISEAKPMQIADSVNFGVYAEKADDWTGAELERLLNEAAIIAIKDDRTVIKREDLRLAFRQIDRSNNRREKGRGEESV